MRYWLVALTLLVTVAASAQSHLPARNVGVRWERGAPRVSFSVKELVDARVREELSSGLRKRLVVTVSSHFKGSNWQLAVREFSCDVTRDLWEDGYLVRIGSKTERLRSLEQVVDRCLVVNGLFVGEAKSYERNKGKDVYFHVRAEFNPISKKQCSELIRPSTGDDPVGPISVSIVRRRICQAERRIEYRSEFIKVPE